VELIEQVVSPHTWARNGGRGQIWYWAPGQALIVRQTDEVHRQIEDLLQQLRRAW
jgi:type 1 glutamine amidotransferase